MFGTLGGPEIILILVLALIIFGPRKLPEIGKSMGRMLAEFRKASNDFKRTLEDEVDAEKARPAEQAGSDQQVLAPRATPPDEDPPPLAVPEAAVPREMAPPPPIEPK